MKQKGYGYTLPRTLNKSTWKHIFTQARRTLSEAHQQWNKDYAAYGLEVANAKRDRAYDLIERRYGNNVIRIIASKYSFSYFWCVRSHKAHNDDQFRALMRGNTMGSTRDRGNQKPIKHHTDPDFKAAP
ncbi:MAG: hypothetical protein [Bacteriophage sp.]|nr:MAG: hypothetical protein [Bacteriophage sp.]